MKQDKVIQNDDYQPKGSNIYWRSESGWGRPDIITTTRRYRYITVDYKYQTGRRHQVISHAHYKNLVPEYQEFEDILQEISEDYCLDPITVAHPIMKTLDVCENDGETYTVLLHQRSVERKKLKYSCYYEILVDSEYDLPFPQRKRWILDPQGRLLDGGITRRNIKTPKNSNTPSVVLKKWY